MVVVGSVYCLLSRT